MWKERFEKLEGYREIDTRKLFGYSYPNRGVNRVCYECSQCHAIKDLAAIDLWRKADKPLVCRPCSATQNAVLAREKGVPALKEFWAKEESKVWMSDLAKSQEHRSKNAKKLNADPAVRKKIADGQRTESAREGKSTKVKADWVLNRESRLEAEKKGRPERLKALRETVSKEEHRELLSKNQRSLWQNAEYREKQKQRWTPDAREKMRELMNSPEMRPRLLTNKSVSHEEEIVGYFMKSIDLRFQAQFIDQYYSFDYFLPDQKIYVEYNGHKWHHPAYVKGNAVHNLKTDKSKISWVKNNRPDCKHLVIDTDGLHSKGYLPKLFENYMSQIDFSFQDLDIRTDVDGKEAEMFLHLFHYKERSKAAPGYRIGAYLNGKLIGIAVYGYATRQEIATSEGFRFKEVLELSRFCIHPMYQKKNFASWLLGKSRLEVKSHFPHARALVTFADTTMDHSGTIYLAAGYSLVRESPPDYHYVNKETGLFMHKRTLWGLASKLKIYEKEYAERHGWEKVFGAKKLKFMFVFK